MRLINSSIRGNTAEDMLRSGKLSAKPHSQTKRLARKQQRARERQAFDRECAQVDREPPAAPTVDSSRTTSVVDHRRRARKQSDKKAKARYSLTQFTGRQVHVRFVDAIGAAEPVRLVFASCAA